jgi:hypothetical protein
MRLLVSAGVAALFVAAPAAGDTRAESASNPKPRLALIDRDPLTLRGTSFVRRERVRVLVEVDGRTEVRRVVANVRGSFSVVFQDVTLEHPCSAGQWARAIGTNGSRAFLKLGPQPLCPPPLRP